MKSPSRRWLWSGFCILALTLAAGAFFYDALFGDRLTLLWDASDYHLPNWNLVSRLWRHGSLPSWNPFLFNGYPIAAEPHSQVFYPPNVLLTLFGEFTPRVEYFQIVLHLLLGGVSTYLLAGLWMESRAARVLAGLVYMLNGFTWNHIEHVAILDTAAWFPFVLYAVERAWRQSTPRALVLGALSVALLVLAGHPQVFYYSLFVVGLTAAFWAIECRRSGPGSALRPLVVLAACAAVGLLLCAVQLLPTQEFSALSNRSGKVPLDIALGGGFSLPHLMTLVQPDFFGSVRGPFVGDSDISQSSLYFGALPLLLVGVALSATQSRRSVYLAIMALFALLVTMGREGHVFAVLYRIVPFFGMFRAPSHFAFVFILFAALLAGHGLDALQRNDFRPGRYLAYLAALGLAVVLLLHFKAHPDPRLSASIAKGWAMLAGAALSVVVLLVLHRRGVLSGNACGAIAVALTFCELYVTGVNATTLGTRAGADTFCEAWTSPLISAVDGLPGKACRHPEEPPLDAPHAASAYRLHVDSQTYKEGNPTTNSLALARIGMDRSLFHEIFLTDGWDPMVLRRHANFHLLVQRISAANAASSVEDRLAAMGRVLAAAAVKHVLFPRGDLRHLEQTLPRAYFVDRARWVPDEKSALELLEDPGFDVYSQVIIESPGAPPARSEDGMSGRRWIPVRFVAQTTSEVQLEVDAERPGYVVFVDSFYPGWEAWVDGQPAELLRANQSFKAVAVGAGRHEVRFSFRSRWMRWGAVISLATLLALVGLGLWRRQLPGR
jgi:hypothetical protein